MPKLLQLNVTANWGSTGKIAESIGLTAMRDGWESAIAYARMMNPSKSLLYKVGSQMDVYKHYVIQRLFDKEGQCSKSPTEKLIKWINTYKPDIMHLHNIHDHWLNYPLLFDYFGSVTTPIVWTFHDCWAFTGGCMHFENAECYKWRTECADCVQRQGLLKDNSANNFQIKKNLVERIADRLTIVGVSEWITNYARESMLKNCRFETLRNGVDLNTFRQDKFQKERLIIGVASVWTEQKGLNDFLKLRELLPDDVSIMLVGLNKKQIGELPRGIIGLSRTNCVGDLVELYNKASIFVNPTYNDTFPTVNLEALACGTPVITYRTGGSPEAIDDKTGMVVEKGNVKALADAIMQVLDRRVIFNSDDCRCRAEANFDKFAQFDKYINLYNSLLS